MDIIQGLGTNGDATIGTGAAFTVLTILGLGLRFGSKRLAHAPFGIDDWLLLTAELLYFTTEVLLLYSVVKQYVYVYSIFYFVIILLVEVAVLVFYRRIFYHSRFRITSAVLGGICLAWLITGLVIEIGYPSHPIGYYFPDGPDTVFHIRYYSFWLAMGIIEVVLETIILILPIRELYMLQLSRHKQILCSLIFAMGGFVIITGIIRMAKVYRPGGGEFDLTAGTIWLNVHVGTTIICACLPTYRPLFSRNPWLSSKIQVLRSPRKSADSDSTHPLPALPQSVHRPDSTDFMDGIYMGQQQDLHGHFTDARRSGSTGGTRPQSEDEGPVRKGEAIGVKRTVEVV
ncbi:MAG: hypothetical protein Q9222_007667 [Ikaeria aurantiellina]